MKGLNNCFVYFRICSILPRCYIFGSYFECLIYFFDDEILFLMMECLIYLYISKNLFFNICNFFKKILNFEYIFLVDICYVIIYIIFYYNFVLSNLIMLIF
jgi:hypothetical protein